MNTTGFEEPSGRVVPVGHCGRVVPLERFGIGVTAGNVGGVGLLVIVAGLIFRSVHGPPVTGPVTTSPVWAFIPRAERRRGAVQMSAYSDITRIGAGGGRQNR